MIITATLRYYGSMKAKIAGFRDALKTSMQEMIRAWHGTSNDPDRFERMLEKHFGTLGQVSSLYPGAYKPRGRKYMISKARKYGHQDMVKYTGNTQRQLQRMIMPTGTTKYMRGVMSGANRALNFSTAGNHPDMRKEITAVSPAEDQTMSNFIDKKMVAFLTAEDEVETVVI